MWGLFRRSSTSSDSRTSTSTSSITSVDIDEPCLRGRSNSLSTVDIESTVHEVVSTQDIDHGVLLDLLRITLLIYNFGETLAIEEAKAATTIAMDNATKVVADMTKENGDAGPLDPNSSTTLEAFMNRSRERELTQKGGESGIGATRNRALTEMAASAPQGRVHRFIDDDYTDIQAAVTVSEGQKRICVVFRGSESRSDWYYDLMLFKKRIGGIGGIEGIASDVAVHSGFHTQLTKGGTYNNITDSVRELINQHPTFAVYVTGHSLGGALATLFGFMFAHEIETPVVVASFASPRVGNYAWKQAFEARTNLYHYRVTNKRDVVTAFPMFRYHHVGNNIQLADTEYKCFARDTTRGWFDESIFTCWSPSEHDCELYYKRLTDNTW